MFKFNNTHIFTGYLKQLLSSINLPTCRIYTQEFAKYFKTHGKEDPRVIESFDTINYTGGSSTKQYKQRLTTRVNYLKANELYNYFWPDIQTQQELTNNNAYWTRTTSTVYTSDKSIPGLTKVLNSPGSTYDTLTHEYLGEYLRFMRDYYNINLMSLYNCFNNKIYNNIYYKHHIKLANPAFDASKGIGKDNAKYIDSYSIFDSQDSRYRIYAFPVKLFSNYTIAIDCDHGIEMFCGLYTTTLETTRKGTNLITKTYRKLNKTLFNQPFLYDALNVKYWNFATDTALVDVEKSAIKYPRLVTDTDITRWDIVNREQDLKLFIKVPTSCRSSITVLEGDFRGFNDVKYIPPGVYNPDGTVFDEKIDKDIKQYSKTNTTWEYEQNHSVINFGDAEDKEAGLDSNEYQFTPIGKLQLLAFNTGESYPFANRLVEYLCNSTITPVDAIADNIKRVQKVMAQNHHYFKIDGLWEDKMQKIIYDYMINAGPVEAIKDDVSVKLIDKRNGRHPRLGHTSKSMLYDVLGYVDKEAEKWYASWTKENDRAAVCNTIQNVDIYGGLYDL